VRRDKHIQCLDLNVHVPTDSSGPSRLERIQPNKDLEERLSILITEEILVGRVGGPGDASR
jgi:hypothetical protein